jgi:hypothetical protein
MDGGMAPAGTLARDRPGPGGQRWGAPAARDAAAETRDRTAPQRMIRPACSASLS